MFAAVIVRGSRADPRETATGDALIAALTPFDQADVTGVWTGDTSIVAQALTWNTAASKHEDTPTICTDTGRVIAAWARLDNRADLFSTLGLENSETLTDPQIILAAHRAWGKDCVDRLEGDFSFVIYDPDQCEAFAARDSLGVRPLFYHINPEVAVIASTAAVFSALMIPGIAPSQEWMARFLGGISLDPAKTAYNGVLKLPPAHHLTVARTGPVEPVRYFEFQDQAPSATRRDPKWLDAYRSAFVHAVETRTESAWTVGAESSGGLDSATIVAHASETLSRRGTDLPCFSLCHLEREPKYLLDVAMYCGVKHNYVLTRPDYQPGQDDFRRAIRALGYPPEHTHALLHIPFFQLCRTHGIRTLLSGFGGDEIVTNQAHFLYRELMKAGRYLQLFQELPGHILERMARFAFLIARHGLDGTQPRQYGTVRRLADSILKPEVIADYGLNDLAIQQANHPETASSLNEFILNRRHFHPFLTGRLEACTLMANSYRIEYRWPLLDRSLMNQYLRTPSLEKRHRQFGRYLHRRANLGKIPEHVLWKVSKRLGQITNFGRDNVLFFSEDSELHRTLEEIVDQDAFKTHIRHLKSNIDNDNVWFESAPKRNNLQSLKALCIWMDG